MRGRLRLRFNTTFLGVIEATLIGLFFIQALRFLVGMLYAQVASASLYPALDLALIDPATPGLIEPVTVRNEIVCVAFALILPLIAVIVGRFQRLIVVAVSMTAIGRYLMTEGNSISPVLAATIVIGGGLFYIVLLIRHRVRLFPYMFLLALGIDQLFRAAGNTLDPSLPIAHTTWSFIFTPWGGVVTLQYATVQLFLSATTIVLAVITLVTWEGEKRVQSEDRISSLDAGLMPFSGGIGFGALLFLQLSLFALPNAIGKRTDVDYTLLVPTLLFASLSSLLPWIQSRARWFIGLFDQVARGWSWMLVIMLLVVLGTRLEGIVAGIALVLAQFLLCLSWWWPIRPQSPREHNFTGLWIVLGMGIFVLLVAFDIFTYEYAFVRDFSTDYAVLNPIIPPLLRGFRGMGIVVLLLGVFLAVVPMMQPRRHIAWPSRRTTPLTVTGIIVTFVLWVTIVASYLARPPIIQGVNNPTSIRIGTYNIHAGFSEFYHYDLEALALTIQRSGADVVLLQEIEAGRMTSFSVDQPLWLARRLGMDVRFYPTNEGLQGLAVLSRIRIVYDHGVLLDSVGLQTGLQRVQVLPDPDAGAIQIYNTWLDPLLDVGGGQSAGVLEQDQQNQLLQIFRIISAQHTDGVLGRTVFGGTFNNVPDSDLISLISDNGFVDCVTADSPVELSATFRRVNALARLDYLWLWQNTLGGGQTCVPAVIDDPVSGEIITWHPSDHRMAIIEVPLR